MICFCVAACSTPSKERPLQRTKISSAGKASAAHAARSPASVEKEIARALTAKNLTTVEVTVDRDLSANVTGSVDDKATKEETLRIVRQTPGVSSVKDFLSIVRVQ
jgi:osmotically-inducible protein OsmY